MTPSIFTDFETGDPGDEQKPNEPQMPEEEIKLAITNEGIFPVKKLEQ